MKIDKYVTNKDITLTNDDIDTARLIKDLQQGMISEEESNTRIENAKKEWESKSTKAYSDLEAKYNELEKRNGDLTTSNAQLKLENIMTQEGFKEEQFKEIAQLRNSLYSEEKDDKVAIQGIKEKYKSTYFPEESKIKTNVPEEPPVNGKGAQTTKPIEVNRNTKISSLFIKK